MAETRFSVLRDIFKPWYVKVGSAVAGACALVGGYSGLQSQFPDHLPLLQAVVVMTHITVLPWWGWLLVLQAVFTYGLFEYVRVHASPAQPGLTLQERAEANRARLRGAGAPLDFTSVTPPPPKPLTKPLRLQLGSWAHVDRFKVSEAACLWAGLLPGASYIYDKAGHPAVVGAERLITSEMSQQIAMDDAPWGSDDLTLGSVTRVDLLAFANRKGIRPSFLFPDAPA
jgi:hypothetical protein